MNNFGENVRRIRKQQGLLQKQLSDLTQIDQSNLSKIERGEYRYTQDLLEKLSRALDVDPHELLREPSNVEVSVVGTRRIPILDYVQAGLPAGVASTFRNDDVSGFLLTDAEDAQDLFAMIVRGSSMSPEYTPGDAVIINRSLAPQPGDVVVGVDQSGEGTLKRYRVLKTDDKGRTVFALVPLNPDFPTLRSDEVRLTIVGTVVEHRKFRRR